MIAEHTIVRDRMARAQRDAELYRLRRELRGTARHRAAVALRRAASHLDHTAATCTTAAPRSTVAAASPSVLRDAA